MTLFLILVALALLYLFMKFLMSSNPKPVVRPKSHSPKSIKERISSEINDTVLGYNVTSIKPGRLWTDADGNQYLDYNIQVDDSEAEQLAEVLGDRFGDSLSRMVITHDPDSDHNVVNNYYIDRMECRGNMNNHHSKVNINTQISNSPK